ncbi:RNA polymerase sigma factor [Lunatibacter salilacus]|uniref:RNA polymerase sigma factor n=1 Tax=Lunatibacter salilacus TaxID=2483804 RepID=UPI00131B4964|nr:sigma-70 family RNA polymerase sigma factor [Lunatibacter salilacus]
MREYIFKKYSQAEIIAGVRENDSEVLRWLYKSQYPKVEQYVTANRGDSDQAKDIFQEAFVAVWKKLKSEDFIPQNGTAVTGFLYQIAKNKWLDKLNSTKHKNTVPLETYHEVKEEENEDREFKFKHIEASFKKLGGNCKELLTRFYFEKQSMAKIAQAFDWTEATARNNKYRCIQRLRENLDTKTKHSI